MTKLSENEKSGGKMEKSIEPKFENGLTSGISKNSSFSITNLVSNSEETKEQSPPLTADSESKGRTIFSLQLTSVNKPN